MTDEAPPLLVEEGAGIPDEVHEVVVEDLSKLDPADRLGRWQRKLLDLSLRNNLLNFKMGKRALKLESPDPGALEDILASGQTLKLLTRPDLMDGADPRESTTTEKWLLERLLQHEYGDCHTLFEASDERGQAGHAS